MADSDSDEDTFISIGTPLPPLEEGSAIRKPVTLQDQTVKDDKGRRRFHGAFTGGFSAGYFNTVGSKEGWAPSTFVSSRSKKAESFNHRAEDYMDESDKGEYGIAPKKVQTSDNFMSNYQENERKRKLAATTSSVIPGLEAIIQDVVPARSSIGMQLLQKMGWKSGQGVGPKSIKKQRKPRRLKVAGDSVRTYGCAMKPESESDDSDEYAAYEFTFAPKDMNPISFDPKDNVYGIGYRGIDPSTALMGSTTGHVSLFEPPTNTRGRKKGIRGQAFGVGAMEEDDDDIYSLDSMSNYDRVLGGEDKKSRFHGWTAPGTRQAITSASYIGQLLEGFTLAEKPLQAKKHYPPPKLPRDFKPIHVFKKPVEESEPTSKNKTMDASTRRDILGEEVKIGSVFDLISTEDKRKMNFLKPSPDTAASEPVKQTTEKHTEKEKQGSLTGSGFKPFAKDPEKQERYEGYLEAAKHGQKYNFDEALPGMTEWEKDREKEEFIRAAQLYRPMTFMMASRFTRAKFEDAVDSAEIPKEEKDEKNYQAKAAELKMFGRLTRDEFEWHPDPLLCKRFNIPDPYPGSCIVGLRTARKDKFSMFNFLSFPDNSSTEKEEKTEPPAPKAIEYVSLSKPGLASAKKVNIFSKIDELQKPATSKEENKDTAESNEAEQHPENKIELSSESGANKEQIEGIDRPPMDLFKAIFQDSDESSSSDDEDEPIKVPTPTLQSMFDSQEPASKILKLDDSFKPSATIVSPNTDIPKTSGTSTTNLEEEEDVYGPTLPPADAVVIEESTKMPFPTYPQDEIFVEKSKIKYKEKAKKKKVKHKKDKKKKSNKSKHKNKSKKKKKKQTTKNESSDSSEYEGSSEDSESEQTSSISDRDILNKIHELPSGKRPTAADFM